MLGSVIVICVNLLLWKKFQFESDEFLNRDQLGVVGKVLVEKEVWHTVLSLCQNRRSHGQKLVTQLPHVSHLVDIIESVEDYSKVGKVLRN